MSAGRVNLSSYVIVELNVLIITNAKHNFQSNNLYTVQVFLNIYPSLYSLHAAAGMLSRNICTYFRRFIALMHINQGLCAFAQDSAYIKMFDET